MRLTRIFVVGLLLLVFAACGDHGENTETSATTTQGSVTTTPGSTSTSVAGSTAPVSVPPTDPTTHLKALRAARQGNGDRVAFEFAEQPAGYAIAYTPKPIAGTSGKETPVKGQSVLLVRLVHASGVDLSTGFKETYTGSRRFSPQPAANVEEIVQVEDFEGTLVWAVGLKSEVPYRAYVLQSPSRVVIDIGETNPPAND